MKYLAVVFAALFSVAAFAQQGEIGVSWDPVGTVCSGTSVSDIEYVVFYDTTPPAAGVQPPNGFANQTAPVTDPSALLTGLQDCTDYYIAVAAHRTSTDEWSRNCSTMNDGYSTVIQGWARPRLSSINQPVVLPGQSYTILLLGTNFQDGIIEAIDVGTGQLDTDLVWGPVIVDSCNQVTAGLSINASVVPGDKELRFIRNGDLVRSYEQLILTVEATTPPPPPTNLRRTQSP